MNFTHLMAFFEVARVGSVSRGAEKLCVSQPAVTREIKDLEARLGVTLFDRHSRGVILTHAGSVLFRYAETIFGLAFDAQREIKQLTNGTDATLKVGATESVAAYLVPAIIHELQNDFPDLNVEVMLASSTDAALAVRRRVNSFGIVEEKFDQGDLETEVLGADPIVAVTIPAHPLLSRRTVARDLVDRELLLTDPHSGLSSAVTSAYADIGLKINPRFRMNSQEGIKRLLLMQGGVAYLPLMSVIEEIRSGKFSLLPVCDVVVQRQIRLIRPVGAPSNETVERFRQIAKRVLAGLQLVSERRCVEEAPASDTKTPSYAIQADQVCTAGC
ncbi:LysR family transcriptional regulator [Paraburkholderia sp. J12]|uniref:LysR family transcriptional regulator n=1 Tax=Paraburkholderia sp. J12 TaxID=2805432 RepID=UPI002ABD9C7B|nr:LysR family transcriptional regulator [Paraburkholderia sp. J12]